MFAFDTALLAARRFITGLIHVSLVHKKAAGLIRKPHLIRSSHFAIIQDIGIPQDFRLDFEFLLKAAC